MANTEIEYMVARYERRYQLMRELVEIEKTLDMLASAGITPSTQLIELQTNLRIVRDGDAPRQEFLPWAPKYIREMHRDAKAMAKGS